MNRTIAFLIVTFTFLSLTCFAQKEKRIYFDCTWKKTKKSNASYYRVVQKITNGNSKAFLVKDYQINDTLQMEGVYKDKKLRIRDGHFVFYHENGKVSEDRRYENGTEEGLAVFYYETGIKSAEIPYVKGKYQGMARWCYENGQVASIENYENDSLVSFELFNEDGTRDTTTKNPSCEAEFPGGKKALQQYLAGNVSYPQEAVDRGIEGKSYVQFVINKDGTVSNVKVTKSAHPLLDAEAVRVVREMPAWAPGKIHNRGVSSYFSLPVNFRF